MDKTILEIYPYGRILYVMPANVFAIVVDLKKKSERVDVIVKYKDIYSQLPDALRDKIKVDTAPYVPETDDERQVDIRVEYNEEEAQQT